jgi:hypothetical protein
MGRRKVLIIAILAIAVLAVAGYGAYLASRRPYLTVSEVWQRRNRLKGHVVTVRGYLGYADTVCTARGCVPHTCDCNTCAARRIWLYDELESRSMPALPGDGVPPQAIAMDILHCSGNECVMGCSPINPETRDEVEFRGKLAMEQEDTVFPYLLLESVWWWEAQQKIDGVWQPMPTGDFVVRLPQQR